MITSQKSDTRNHRIPTRIKPLVVGLRTMLAGGAFLGQGAMADAVDAIAANTLPVPAAQWVQSGAGTLDASPTGSMVINQASDKAVFNWDSFNVGASGKVVFQQPSVTSQALNQIQDQNPSVILGSITANGNVALINPNGIAFGKGATVDTNVFLASTLKLSEEAMSRGITKVIDKDGSAALVSDGSNPAASIHIAEGARISSHGMGGRIMIIAPNVVNRGEINSADGQVIVAAAQDKVYLQEASPTSGVNGLLVEVATGGKVENIGKIIADRGNITLAGFAVNQEGLVSATTTVRTAGAIRLLAREKGDNPVDLDGAGNYTLLPNRTTRDADLGDGLGTVAKVKLATGSHTEVRPDISDTTKAVDDAAQPRGNVEIMAGGIHLQKEAVISARSGNVSLTATSNPYDPAVDPGYSPDIRVQADAGSIIDVSGLKQVSLPMSRNSVEVELRKNEFRDSPLQRDGALYGKTVSVDIRKGALIADISGALARIERTVAERSTSAGSVHMRSSGDVVLNPDASIDVSGGSVVYQAGAVKSTNLLASDGRLYDFSTASPSLTYRSASTISRFEPSYVEGKDAGALSIDSHHLQFEGDLLGQTISGPYQRESLPATSRLSINLALLDDDFQSVAFSNKTSGRALSFESPFPEVAEGKVAPLLLDAKLLSSGGIGKTSILTHADFSLPRNVNLRLPDQGSLSVDAGKISVSGTLDAPSGNVSFKTHLTGATQGVLSGAINIRDGAVINVSGKWFNDRLIYQKEAIPDSVLAIKGGTIDMKAEGDVLLEAGSLLDVSGGARLRINNTLQAGDAGSISLEAALLNGSSLRMEGNVRGFGLQQGGSIQLVTNEIVVTPGKAPAKADDATYQPLYLKPTLFSQSGFAKVRLISNLNGVTIKSGSHVNLTPVNWRMGTGAYAVSDRRSLAGLVDNWVLPLNEQRPVSLELGLRQTVGRGRRNAGLTLEDHADITAPAKASVSMVSDNMIHVDGNIKAPGGTLRLTVAAPVNQDESLGFVAEQGVYLGSGANLDVKGQFVPVPQYDYRVTDGQVLSGGHVTLRAERGFVVLSPGSRIDVSGTSAVLDVPGLAGGPSDTGFQQRVVSSNAGRLSIDAAEGAYLFGKMEGHADRGAVAGSLDVNLSSLIRNDLRDPSIIEALGQTIYPEVSRYISVVPNAPKAAWAGQLEVPEALYGQLILPVRTVKQAGFENLGLKVESPLTDYAGEVVVPHDAIRFDRSVSLVVPGQLTLDAPVIAWGGETSGIVNLQGGYVQMGSGQARSAPIPDEIVEGVGRIAIRGQWIDIKGSASLQGFKLAEIDSQSDIRTTGLRILPEQNDYIGQLTSYGDLKLLARQLYPTTLSSYAIESLAQGGRLTLMQNPGRAGDVLSAGGQLKLHAALLSIDGTIKAPLGTVSLVADEQLILREKANVSVSASGLLIPFGTAPGGLDWTYPISNDISQVFTAPPSKNVLISAPSIDLQKGATIDLSGGGDLYANEFVAGPGGSYDVLANNFAPVAGSDSYSSKFAILPWVKDGMAPFDPYYQSISPATGGNAVYLGAGSGLPAGLYVKAPAQYALLPGAFLVTELTGHSDLQPGETLLTQDGIPVVSGYEVNQFSGSHDARTSAYAIQTGTQARQYSSYTDFRASSFFPAQATLKGEQLPYMPEDAGQLTINSSTALNLNGTINAQQGRSGADARVDIIADNLRIANSKDGFDSAAVNLLSDQLNKLKVGSLLLGGSRSGDRQNEKITAVASSVTLGQGVKLSGHEVSLVANSALTMEEGAQLTGGGDQGGALDKLTVSQGSAFIKVGGAMPQSFSRFALPPVVLEDGTEEIPSFSGSISVADGASLGDSSSTILDGPAGVTVGGHLDVRGGGLWLGADRIALGGDDPFVAGLTLTDTQLGQMKFDQLTINAQKSVDIYGSIDSQLKQLLVNAPMIRGMNTSGDVVNLNVQQMTLQNIASLTPDEADLIVDGTTQLALKGSLMGIGPGLLAFSGFNQIDLTASKAINGQGIGGIVADADITMHTPLYTGTSGSKTILDLGNHQLSMLNVTGDAATARDYGGLGAELDILAGGYTLGTTVGLHSGAMAVRIGEAGITLENGAVIDLSGTPQVFNAQSIMTQGGRLALRAQGGQIALGDGVLLDVSAVMGQAGDIVLDAGSGRLMLDASSKLEGKGVTGGGLSVRTGSTEASLLDSVVQAASDGGFNRAFSYSALQGDLEVPATTTLTARHISLETDDGSIHVSGTLDASSPLGGTIKLSAADHIVLEQFGQLRATSSDGRAEPGRIMINAMDVNHDGVADIALRSGSTVDVSGATEATAGKVLLRTEMLGTGDDIRISEANSDIVGASSYTAEAVRVYGDSSLSKAPVPIIDDGTGGNEENTDPAAGGDTGAVTDPGTETPADETTVEAGDGGTTDGTINDGDSGSEDPGYKGFYITETETALWKTDADALMSHAEAIEQRLGGGIRVVPGLQVDSSDDLTISTAIDLAGWKWNGLPGGLTLRSAGSMHVLNPISDGFASTVLDLGGLYGTATIADAIQSFDSWNIRLGAGSNLAGSDPMAIQPGGTGGLNIAESGLVRSGTGSIEVATAGDLTLDTSTAAIYTAGKVDAENPFGSLHNAYVAYQFYAQYPSQGGYIDIDVGGNFNATMAASGQFVPDWLVRNGNWNGLMEEGQMPVSWGIAIDQPDTISYAFSPEQFAFQQNVGVLAGGSVNIKTGGSMVDVSVMIPTTGKQIGTPVDPSDPLSAYQDNVVDVTGGGHLTIQSEGNIEGGAFLVDQGSASIHAGGVIGASTLDRSGVLLAPGQSSFQVTSNRGVEIGTVFDPYLVRQRSVISDSQGRNFFTHYGEEGALSLNAVSGNVVLANNPETISNRYVNGMDGSPVIYGDVEKQVLTYYPGTLDVIADAGQIKVMNSFTLHPTHMGNLRILADDSVTSAPDVNTYINLSDTDPTLLPNLLRPAQTLDDFIQRISPVATTADIIHAQVPMHQEDLQAVQVVARKGDIASNAGFEFFLSKRFEAMAGGNITNASWVAQNIRPSDVSVLAAGRDIRFTIDRNPFSGAIGSQNGRIELAGPGQLQILAGRNIDLGSSVGITTIGNTYNSALPAGGATLDILAGLSGKMDEAGFIKAYISNQDQYREALVAYLDQMALSTPDVMSVQATASADPVQQFEQLPVEQQRQFLYQVLFEEVRTSALDAAKNPATSGSAYARGYKAIDTLFPGSDWKGDLALFFSKIQTVAGGDINILTPGGMVNAGLASAFSGSKTAADLGIVAQSSGAIRAVVKDNFMVNQSRVFSLDGSDIVIWSSEGNIDAGRGAKAALSIPPPRITFDSKGNMITIFPPAVSGSGIRTAASTEGRQPGDVYLAAPKGIVDAGEAGIGGKNVTIAATAVVGASNISVSGSATGVPSTPSVAVPSVGAASAAAAATQSAQSAGDGAKEEDNKRARKKRVHWNVELVGYPSGSGNKS